MTSVKSAFYENPIKVAHMLRVGFSMIAGNGCCNLILSLIFGTCTHASTLALASVKKLAWGGRMWDILKSWLAPQVKMVTYQLRRHVKPNNPPSCLPSDCIFVRIFPNDNRIIKLYKLTKKTWENTVTREYLDWQIKRWSAWQHQVQLASIFPIEISPRNE